MNFKFLNIIPFLVFVIACNTQKNEIEIQNKKAALSQNETEHVINKWLNLWETYDLNLLDDIFLQTEDLTYFSSEKEGLMIGYKHLKPHHLGFGFVEGGKQPEKSLWLEDMTTKIYGETAMVAAVWYFGDRNAVKDSISKGPVTFILSNDKQGNAKIIHTHFANY
ncbi:MULTISPECIES: hypothetical protein [Aquimarina]|uniref:hypothetical protein n=1 Tax=Aquimarina TaxID=290174 RepID=UPI0009455146|nr:MULTISPECIES: hypothetical protein [Aquimarina]